MAWPALRPFAADGRGPRLSRVDRPQRRNGARSFADDLVEDRGVVPTRAFSHCDVLKVSLQIYDLSAGRGRWPPAGGLFFFPEAATYFVLSRREPPDDGRLRAVFFFLLPKRQPSSYLVAVSRRTAGGLFFFSPNDGRLRAVFFFPNRSGNLLRRTIPCVFFVLIRGSI